MAPRVQSCAALPSPSGLPFQIVLPPFGVGGQWGVDCSFQNEAGPAPQARPAPPHPGGVDLHPAAQAWSRPLVCVGSPRSRCSRPPLCVAQLRCADARVFSYLSPGARVPHPVTSRSLQSLLICVGADFPNLVFPFAPSSPPPPPPPRCLLR